MISFSDAKLLSYSHSHTYLGDNFRIGSRKNIDIEGELYALDNFSGISDIWSGISGFVDSATDYDDIIINGYNFGNGVINSINFGQSIDVRRKPYSVSLSIVDTGNLFNLSGQYYSGLDFENPNYPSHLLESLSENFSFDIKDKAAGEYSHSVSLKFLSGAATGGSQNAIQMAKQFASGLIYSTPGFAVLNGQYDGFYEVGTKKYFTETYNQITNECSFEVNSKIGTGNACYGIIFTHSLSILENGEGRVKESANVEGFCEDVYSYAQQGYSDNIGLAYDRCDEVYSAYLTGDLQTRYISLSKQNNIFEGLISYEIEYTDSPSIASGYVWEYSNTINTNGDCIYSVDENGSIIGTKSECGDQDVFDSALNGWVNDVKSSISGRAYNFYNAATNQTKSLSLRAAEQSFGYFKGTINYNYTYSDDINGSVDGFKKIVLSVEDSLPTPFISQFDIFGVKQLVQPGYIANQGTRTARLEINGERGEILDTYLAYAETKLSSVKPSGEDPYISQASYSLSPNNNQFSSQIEWKYVGEKAFEDTSV